MLPTSTTNLCQTQNKAKFKWRYFEYFWKYAYQSVSGESITRRIFIFLAAGDPLGGKLTSPLESVFELAVELKLVVRSLSREGRRLLKFTPPDIFNFCKNSMLSQNLALSVCLKCFKTWEYSKNSSVKHAVQARKKCLPVLSFTWFSSAGLYALKRENIQIINFLQLPNKSSKWNFSSIDHPGDCFSKAEWQIVLYVFKIFKDHL